MSRLAATTAALAHQRAWFRDLRERAAAGEQIALVNADAPQEILRAMDVPYVVNQWWASIVTAKQLAQESLAVVAGLGHPDDSRQYDVLALGSRGVADQDALWGGLPRPGIVIAELSGDATGKVFEAWTDDPDVAFFPYERTAAVPAPEAWWDRVDHDWRSVFGADRIALMAQENRELITFLQERTGRVFDLDRLREVMALVNEQEELNRRTRDLVARARPTPVRVSDTIPAVMVPQWHRGSPWGRDAARALHDEVEALVAAGTSVVPDERVRLMWVGRGLWGDTALYRRFEEEFGAVFVWSMYLAIAADGYVRHGEDPVEALAARFVGITDLLYSPLLAPPWYVREAQTHGVDGVVHLVADDVAGARFITLALEEAGIPVLEISASNADPRALERADVGGRIARFVGTLADGADQRPRRSSHNP